MQRAEKYVEYPRASERTRLFFFFFFFFQLHYLVNVLKGTTDLVA